ncbi:MAG TPA: hypothetical protein VMT04_09585 [Terriglobales bacterium]|nr:hypothetical protein [Terriglobales bacterium]
MKFFKYILAFVLTVVLLGIARHLALRIPQFMESSSNGVELSHTTVTEKVGSGDVQIIANLVNPSSDENYSLYLFYKIGKGESQFTSLKMQPVEGTNDQFSAVIPSQPKGKRAYYYLSLSDSQGKKILTLPEKIDLLNNPFLIKFKGKVPPYVIVPHVLFMFASVFFVFLVMFASWEILWGKDSLRKLSLDSLWALILSFVGGVPLGILMTSLTFGETWGGFPVFTDITDSKTSILIFYWLIFVILIKGSAFKKDKTKNLLPDKILAWFGILGYILTLAIYLIPHSI